jgi:predicted 3-demethylubiquinone-9 3-methyltransferase (glyoxalase superfamily)
MAALQKITPCLWFDSEAEEAARFYVAIFENARIGRISRYGQEGIEIHGRPEGSVMTVEFEIEGQNFTALNGGPHSKFNEAISFQIPCETQEEIEPLLGETLRRRRNRSEVGSRTSSAFPGRYFRPTYPI